MTIRQPQAGVMPGAERAYTHREKKGPKGGEGWVVHSHSTRTVRLTLWFADHRGWHVNCVEKPIDFEVIVTNTNRQDGPPKWRVDGILCLGEMPAMSWHEKGTSPSALGTAVQEVLQHWLPGYVMEVSQRVAWATKHADEPPPEQPYRNLSGLQAFKAAAS